MRAILIVVVLALAIAAGTEGARLARLQKVANPSFKVPTPAEAEEMREAAFQRLARAKAEAAAAAEKAEEEHTAKVHHLLQEEFAKARAASHIPEPQAAAPAKANAPAVPYKVLQGKLAEEAHDQARDQQAAAKIAKLKSDAEAEKKVKEAAVQEASDRHFAEVEEAKMRKEGTWDAHVAAVNKAAEDKKKAEEEAAAAKAKAEAEAAAKAKLDALHDEQALLEHAKEASDELHHMHIAPEDKALQAAHEEHEALTALYKTETPIHQAAEHAEAAHAADLAKVEAVIKAATDKQDAALKVLEDELKAVMEHLAKASLTDTMLRVNLKAHIESLQHTIATDKATFATEIAKVEAQKKTAEDGLVAARATLHASQKKILEGHHKFATLQLAYHELVLTNQKSEIDTYMAPYATLIAKHAGPNGDAHRHAYLQAEHDKATSVFDKIVAELEGKVKVAKAEEDAAVKALNEHMV